MDKSATYKLTYGIFVLGVKDGDKLNGCIVNTAIQVASDPLRLSTACMVENLTREIIKKTGEFTVTIVNESMPLDMIGRFGFQSGRDADKFDGLAYKLDERGIPYLEDNMVAMFSCKVVESHELGSHTLFISEVIDAKVFNQGNPMTYAYYHGLKSGKIKNTQTVPTATDSSKASSESDFEKYKCSICGFVYDEADGDPARGIQPGTKWTDIPVDYVCPICGAPKDAFEKI